jgi:hypothetical protein
VTVLKGSLLILSSSISISNSVTNAIPWSLVDPASVHLLWGSEQTIEKTPFSFAVMRATASAASNRRRNASADVVDR